MLCLFRDMNHPPSLLSEMELGLGFTCFSLFCVGSTVSCLGVRVPSLPLESREIMEPALPRSRLAGRFAFPAAALLAFAFAVLVGVGVAMPSMELHLDTTLLYAVHPELKDFSAFIDAMGLPQLMQTKVSVWHCLERTGS